MSEDEESFNGGASKRTYKILLLGDEGVGKTSIINRFTLNKFKKDQNVISSIKKADIRC